MFVLFGQGQSVDVCWFLKDQVVKEDEISSNGQFNLTFIFKKKRYLLAFRSGFVISLQSSKLKLHNALKYRDYNQLQVFVFFMTNISCS